MGSGRAIRATRSVERSLAVVTAAVAILLFGFVYIAEEILEGETRGFDEVILLSLRTPGDTARPIGPLWLQEMVRDFTALGSTGVLTVVTLAAVGWLLISRKQRMAGFVLLAVVGGVVLSSLLKIGFARPRPDLVPHAMAVFTLSFPSGHAMMSAVVYLTLGDLLARSQPSLAGKIYFLSLALVLTLLVGCSRVYLGVHWPTDVLAGWAAGASWALMCWLLMGHLQHAGLIEPENVDAANEKDGSDER
ncbi:phosphatase PAP2 family protein [Tabrizicola sp. KVB23]|uniref:Phosphatase PAP2 family protein n=2 Tax=Fuscibacter oryzae TaxID=2803939 RepID=A0A8J7MXY5_9RHOB|nr:phosphatase PAP2 family protein [Fuscibacter oryzae]